MLRQIVIVVIVTLGVFSASTVGMCQESSSTSTVPQKKTSFFGQLDQFGKKLVGGIFADKSPNAAEKSSTHDTSRFSRSPMQSSFSQGRTGSVLDATQKAPAVGKTITAKKEPSKNHSTPSMNSRLADRRTVVVKNSQPQMQPKNQPQASNTAVESRPLHERLMGFSRSHFAQKVNPEATQETIPSKPVAKQYSGPAQPQTATTTRQAVSKSVTAQTSKPAQADAEKDIAAAMKRPLSKPTAGSRQTPVFKSKPVLTDKTNSGPIPTLARKNTAAGPTPAIKKSDAQKALAKQTTVKASSAQQSVARTGGNTVASQPAKHTESGNVVVEAKIDARRGSKQLGNVLFERRSPMLSVRTMGPRQISVGKESTYTVFIDNLGKADAADVVVAIALPQWAEVLGAEPSQGTTRRPRAGNVQGHFNWQVGNLAAGGRERIALRIVPRESRPIDLGVSWTFKPIVSQTKIEVQEPKMEIRLNGPREVAYGKSQKYQLEIVNSGNGLAEDVAITLMPVTAGAGLPSTHRLGAFPAGKKMALEIALTARQKDGLAVKVDLHNEGKICARLDEKILVRKAELEMVADGPGMQYVGTVATYRVRLRNTGNADAKGLNVTAKIPPNAKFLASDSGGKLLKEQAKAVWSLASLPPGTEKVLELKCELVRAGFNRIDVETKAEDQIQISTAVGTNVEAMADLTLEVTDPTGPVPVGKEAVYQIRIRNRGSKQADGIEAVAYFSQGIEPISVSGGSHTLGPGQVIFRGIDTLEAGKEVVLKITARADTPGNHMFRAEIHCKPLNTKLVGEETTHFFNGTLVADRPTVNQRVVNRPAVNRQTANRRPPAEPSTMANEPKKTVLKETRTADRRNLWGDTPDDEKTPTVAPRYRQ